MGSNYSGWLVCRCLPRGIGAARRRESASIFSLKRALPKAQPFFGTMGSDSNGTDLSVEGLIDHSVTRTEQHRSRTNSALLFWVAIFPDLLPRELPRFGEPWKWLRTPLHGARLQPSGA
jgi:hypothetical protein